MKNHKIFQKKTSRMLMEKAEFSKLFFFEEEHWWFVSKRYLVNSIFKTQKFKGKIVDLGCGTGKITKSLTKFGPTTGVDISPIAVSLAKHRGLHHLHQSSIENLPFPSANFDYATCLGVLYHRQVKNDSKALAEIYRILKPKGTLILITPANQRLFGNHDRNQHGIRRHSKQGLTKKLQQAGFNIKRISYFGSFFFPLVYIKTLARTLARKPPKTHIRYQSRPSLGQLLFTMGLQKRNQRFKIL